MATHKLSLTAQREFFLLGVVLFYNSTNRAVDEHGMCVYHRTIASPGCAIGRRQRQLEDKEGNVFQVNSFLTYDLKYLGLNFLSDTQKLHDLKPNWDKTGLSLLGKHNLSLLISEHQLNRKNFNCVLGE